MEKISPQGWLILSVAVVLVAAVLAGQDLIEGRIVDWVAGILVGGASATALAKRSG